MRVNIMGSEVVSINNTTDGRFNIFVTIIFKGYLTKIGTKSTIGEFTRSDLEILYSVLSSLQSFLFIDGVKFFGF